MVPVSLTISPLRDEDGAIVGRLCDRPRHDRAPACSSVCPEPDRGGPGPVGDDQPAGKITDVNEATVKVIGVPREALIGSDFSQYFTDPTRPTRAYARAFALGRSSTTR
jgi:PAS domain-containing protein